MPVSFYCDLYSTCNSCQAGSLLRYSDQARCVLATEVPPCRCHVDNPLLIRPDFQCFVSMLPFARNSISLHRQSTVSSRIHYRFLELLLHNIAQQSDFPDNLYSLTSVLLSTTHLRREHNGRILIPLQLRRWLPPKTIKQNSTMRLEVPLSLPNGDALHHRKISHCLHGKKTKRHSRWYQSPTKKQKSHPTIHSQRSSSSSHRQITSSRART